MNNAITACLCIAMLAPMLRAQTAPSTAPSAESDDMRNSCDLLLRTVVRRPYGIAWQSTPAQVDEERPTLRKVSMKPIDTPANGVFLLFAGKVLSEPQYIQAAVDAARGVVASQEQNGDIPAVATFAQTAGGHDEPTVVPDRAATRAGLALLCTVISEAPLRPEELAQFKGAATRATQWLVRQQGKTGAWPRAYPPGAAAMDTHRILRFDDEDFRDSTLALFLAADVLQSKTAEDGARKAAQLLTIDRLGNPENSRGLWPSAATIGGEPLSGEEFSNFTRGADVLASRYAIETLFVAALMNDDSGVLPPLEDAIASLSRVRRDDHLWDRHPEVPLIFGEGKDNPTMQEQTRGTFGCNDLLAAAESMKLLGPSLFKEQLEKSCSIRLRIALVLCGLTDRPIAQDVIAPILPTASKLR